MATGRRLTKIAEIGERIVGRLDELRSGRGLPEDEIDMRDLVEVALDTMEVSEAVYDPGGDSRALVTGFVSKPNEVFGDAAVSGGVCIKPGNIRLSMPNLIRACRTATGTIHEISLSSIVLLALALWEIASTARVDLTIKEVLVFRAMWELGGANRSLPEDEVLHRANQDFASQQLAPLAKAELGTVLEQLQALRCIKPEAAPTGWRVVEQIEYEYR